jgi:signal peptidase I
VTVDNSSGRLQQTVSEPVVSTILNTWREANEQHWLPISGHSMLPTLCDGDRVLVTHDLSSVRRGDVIVFRQDDGLVAHRVVRVTGHIGARRFRTRGDNVIRFDPEVSEPSVIGRVLAVSGQKGSIRIDTRGWRFAGWLLACTTMVVAWIYAGARRAKRVCLGSRPVPGTSLVQNVGKALVASWLAGVRWTMRKR